MQIRNGANSETLNYAEFGFGDGRSGKPNRAWETLRALAEQRGIIRDAGKAGRTWPKVEKRIQEIRKVFRKQLACARINWQSATYHFSVYRLFSTVALGSSTAAPIATGRSDPVPGRAFHPAVDQRLSRRTVIA